MPSLPELTDAKLLSLGLLLLFVGFILFNRIVASRARGRFMRDHGCRPVQAKYPCKDPLLNLDFMRSNLTALKEHRVLQGACERFEEFGNTYQANLLGNFQIVTREPENLKTVLSVKFKDFSIGNRMLPLGKLLGLGIFTADGERWAHSRQLIRPNFMKEQVADIAAFERHVQTLLSKIPQDGSTFDLQELFFRLTIDSATEFLFGRSSNTLTEESGEGVRFAEAFNKAQYDCVVRVRMGPLARFRMSKAQREGDEAIRVCHEYVDRFVDEAVRYRQTQDVEKQVTRGEEKYVFLRELAKTTGDRKRLRDELLNVLLAGRDTTASLLSNMFFEIAKQPAIWEKLRSEIQSLNGRTPTYEQLRGLKYLKYCMNESLRMHPAVPGNIRMAIRDTVLPLGGGHDGKSPVLVPRGGYVAYSPFAMQRRKDIYGEDAHIFRPERWESLRPGWEYLPFNGGPRICLGQQYALTEASYVTTRIVQHFSRLESRDAGPWQENLTFTVCSLNGTRVSLIPA